MTHKIVASADVSVVIPTFNATAFIRPALATVFAQTQLPREIVVVDDGSRDGTPALIDEIGKTAPVPLRLIQMPRNTGGPAQPLNAGLAAANCELVAILEQDDLMAPERIARLAGAAARHPECIMTIGRPAIVTEENGHLTWADAVPPPGDIPQYVAHGAGETFVVPSDVAFRSLMGANFIYSNSNVMLRRTPVRALGGFDPRWPINSDADLEFRILQASPIAVVNSALCGYRSRPDSLYHSRARRAREDGLLIRLKWGSRRWDWAAEEAQRVYWAVRADLLTALRGGDVPRSLRLGRALLSSGAFRRHVLSSVGIGTFQNKAGL